jgi:hypothetical protein
MAGRGRAPKPASERRNRTEPQRGDWVDLLPLEKSVLPNLPKEHLVCKRTKSAWEAWRKDPATAMFGPAEVQLCVDLAYVYETWVNDPTASLAAELRQRQDGLGLSPKGKQDRRWRVVRGEAEVSQIRPASVHRLRVVAPDGA